MLGTIAGGVMIGSLSGLMSNMAISVSCGLFAGFLSAFWYSIVHPRLNKTSVFDSHGVLGAFWLVSIFGSIVLAPALLQNYINHQINGTTLLGNSNLTITNSDTATLQLAYAGIAAGTGLVLGLIASVVSLILRTPDDDFNDSSLFVRKDYGMYVPTKEER